MFSFVTFPMMVYFPVYIYNKMRSNRHDVTNMLPCKVETCSLTNTFNIECYYQHKPIRLSDGLSELTSYCKSIDVLDQTNNNTLNIHMVSKDTESYDLMRGLIRVNEDENVCYLPMLSQID